eukprot:3863065-Rhodomonas_salina.2
MIAATLRVTVELWHTRPGRRPGVPVMMLAELSVTGSGCCGCTPPARRPTKRLRAGPRAGQV